MELEEIRRQIDRIDRRLVKLLGERLEMAARTRRYKNAVHDPEREATVMSNVRKLGTGLLRRDYIEALFRQIIAESHRVENHRHCLTAPATRRKPGGKRVKISRFPEEGAT